MSTPLDFGDLLDERTRNFAGREWLFNAMFEWVADRTAGRYFVITGDPGSGKSAIAAQLVRFARNGGPVARPATAILDAWHFCSARERRWIDPHVFTESIALQLAARFGAFRDELLRQRSGSDVRIVVHQHNITANHVTGVEIKSLDLSGLAPDEAFNQTVRGPLEALCRTDKEANIFILIDGLDEASGFGGRINIIDLVTQAERLPETVRWVVTTREDPAVLRALRRQGLTEKSLTSRESFKPAYADAKTYVLQFVGMDPALRHELGNEALREEFAEKAAGKSNGNFLYLSYLMKMLSTKVANGSRASEFSNLPEGLDGVYLEYLDRLLDGDLEAWRVRYGPFLGTLAVAQEAMTEDQLAVAVNLPREEVRIMMATVSPFLKNIERRDRYTLYHESFGEFLLDSERSGEFWRDRTAQHHRIVEAFRRNRAWSEVQWTTMDDYGLRHIIYHVIEGSEDGLTEVGAILCPAFARSKSIRFGSERPVLNDLRIAIDSAVRHADLTALFRLVWLSVVWRERLAHALVPETLPLRIRLGQVDSALEMIESLDPSSAYLWNEEDAVRVQMARGLAEQDRLDDALALVSALRNRQAIPDAICSVAERYAVIDVARAVAVARDAGAKTISPSFGAFLAQKNEFIETALELARGEAHCLEAIALAVAHTDFQRALEIANSVAGYTEYRAGSTRYRDANAARASLAVEMCGEPDIAFALLDSVTERQERWRAGLAIAVSGAGNQAIVDNLWKMLSTRFFSDDGFLRSLLLVALTTVESRRPSLVKDLQACIDDTWAFDLDAAADVLDRVDIGALRRIPQTLELAKRTLSAFLKRLNDAWWLSASSFPAGAVAPLAGAFASFDADQAAQLVALGARLNPSAGTMEAETQLAIVKKLARYDPQATVRLIEKQSHSGSHRDWVELIRAVAATDPRLALAIADRVDPRFARSKAIFVGLIGEQLRMPEQREFARELLAHIPSLSQSEAFFEPMRRAKEALAGELSREDTAQALAFAHTAFGEDKQFSLEEVVVELARRDFVQACALENSLEGFPKIHALIALAQIAPTFTERITLLERAKDLILLQPPSLDERIQAWGAIVREMARLEPRTALQWAIRENSSYLLEELVANAVSSILARDPNTDVLNLAVVILEGDPEDPISFSTFGNRSVALIALFSVINPTQIREVLDWLTSTAPELAHRMHAWYIAAVDPDAALRSWGVLGETFVSVGFEEVAARRASQNPEAALEFYRQHGSGNDGEVLPTVFRSIAVRDVDEAMRLIGTWRWKSAIAKSDALRAVAKAAAKQDWRRALVIARQSVEALEGDASGEYVLAGILEAVLNAVTLHTPKSMRTEICTEVGKVVITIIDPSERLRAHRSLLSTLLKLSIEPPSLLCEILYGLSKGSRGTLPELLPLLIKAISRTGPGVANKLLLDIEAVELMAAV